MAYRGIHILAVLFILSSTASAQLISPLEVKLLQRFKAFLYEGVTLDNAEKVAAGTADPFVYVEVGGGDLPVCYYHFPIKEDSLSMFAEAIQLPPKLSLAPISVLEKTPAKYYLTISIYEVSGERSGLRSEWATYVTKTGDEQPRMLILETATSESSLNPVNLQTEPAEHFLYEGDDDMLTTEIVSGLSSFSAAIQLPKHSIKASLLTRSWGASREVLYWRNGIADLQNVNGLIAYRRVHWIPPTDVQVNHQSPWAAFITSSPEWVLLYDQRIDMSIRPWVNADDLDVPLDPVFREELLQTKASIFSALERERAEAIAEGTAEPMADFLLESSPPAIFIDFEILPDLRDEFAQAIPLPKGFELARVEPYDGLGNRYFLNLNIYLAGGLAPGYRAEWSIFVKKKGDPSPRFMIVEAQTNGVSIDPVDLITMPAEVFQYTNDDGILNIDIQTPNTSFQAIIHIPQEPERREINLRWAESNNLVYWKNGVADKVYYNESAYGSVALVPNESVAVTDETRWAEYVRLDHVFIYEGPQVFVVSPWNNLDELVSW